MRGYQKRPKNGHGHTQKRPEKRSKHPRTRAKRPRIMDHNHNDPLAPPLTQGLSGDREDLQARA